MFKDFTEFLIEGKVNETHKPGHMIQLISENAQAYHDDDDETHERKGYLTEIREGCDKLLHEDLLPGGKSCTPPKQGKPGTCTMG